MAEPVIVISCEHGGNRIPKPYQPLFVRHVDLLQSHRGYDPGALALARQMAAAFALRPAISTISRLLVDLNRSPGHPRLFSEISRRFDPAVRQAILNRYYTPYRRKIQQQVGSAIAGGGRVIHVASHSFTPLLNKRVRPMDIGLLYDPKREVEAAFCRAWKKNILETSSALQGIIVHMNAPYKGISDSIPAYFRKIFPAHYVGIELEVNQGWYLHHRNRWRKLCAAIVAALEMLV